MTYSRRGFWALALPCIGLVLIAALAATASPAQTNGNGVTGYTTAQKTLVGGETEGPFEGLTIAGGDAYEVRRLATARPNRRKRRVSVIYFGQLTDFQLADEESPAREERFDGDPFRRASAAGFRPQETMTVHEIEMAIRQVNRFVRSPIRQRGGKRARLANVVATGDLADGMQRNEVEWVRTLLEGGQLDPNSGTTDLAGTLCPPGTPLDNPANYTGVQDYDDYSPDNPLFWDPESLLGIYAERGFPTYPGLLDRAQQPFQAEGLKVPSYIAFGNHDALYIGTSAVFPGVLTPGASFEQTAVNCLKPVYPVSDQDAAAGGLSPEFLQSLLTSDPGKVMQVPPDANREFVDHEQYKQVFVGHQQRDNHGFAYVDQSELQASGGHAAYYSFSPRPGIRYIVLDTVSEAGQLVSPSSFSDNGISDGSKGNIDDPQWQWLKKEITKAENRDELIIPFAHHATPQLTVEVPDELGRCSGIPFHGHDLNASCDTDPRSSTPIHGGEDLEALFEAHPNVVLFVAGHSHENEILAHPSPKGGFWEIKSSAVADHPAQQRLIEVMNNLDGTLSIFGTDIDLAAPAGIPAPGSPAAGFDIKTLAAIARTVEYNDPHRDIDDFGKPVAPGFRLGGEEDRNVELLIRDPRLRKGRCAVKLRGTKRRDNLVGTVSGDRMKGRGGNDRLRGFGGRDCLGGGKGRDRLQGGGGRDKLLGGRGRDRLSGGRGADRIRAKGGKRDVVRCGPGRDRVTADRRDKVSRRSCERVRRR